MIAREISPGLATGSTTFQKVCHGLQPSRRAFLRLYHCAWVFATTDSEH
jgi:hypothetical protein